MQEIWKDIEGYEGLYQISNTGKVMSFNKSSVSPNGTGHVLTPWNTRNYLCVNLSKDGKSKTFLVHRLVASAFIPNPNNYPQVNHIDENKANNNVENLEWCSHEYNMSYGTCRIRQGVTHGMPIEQSTINGIPIATYCSAEIASKITGIDASSIHKCCKLTRKYAGGYSWKYIKSNYYSCQK